MYSGEKLNSLSHLVGVIFSLIALGSLVTVGIQSNDIWILASFSFFGLTLVLLYAMSTLYHSIQPSPLKRLFQKLDHVAIYLLILGTYTPFLLVTLRAENGWLFMMIIGALALIGITSEFLLSGRAIKIVQVLIYVSMGWSCTFEFENLSTALPPEGTMLLLAGGVTYTCGIIFYILDKLKKLNHAHGIWHFFVLFGSILHFISIIGYIR